ncbi:hypothetical protein NPIL_231691 [Nephila pilipes]|uniref:WAP domain-containing protein n=1 Tax=Nephila pilipes TaxID=299642 RepID=A0A8X6T8J7_NEPPI|nr:hypothetical protein NPIL_231691 [Nephila pilipes]
MTIKEIICNNTANFEKNVCPALRIGNCTSWEVECCSSKDCVHQEACCRTGCKFGCMKIVPGDDSRVNPDINMDKFLCDKYKAASPKPEITTFSIE